MAGLIAIASAHVPSISALADEVDFNRDIQPILSDACYHCHGPDAARRESDFRLDKETDALDPDRKAIVPGDVDASELARRIQSPDAEQQMPPPSSERQLSDAERKKLIAWIQQGAKWSKHWSFVPPQRPNPPGLDAIGSQWAKNPIDHFVYQSLRKHDWRPADPAAKTTWLRRVSFDLTGLPPTLKELDRFLQDDSPDGYAKVVRRLLNSPRYGERMASVWLDAARYADTSGYQNDGPREMWRYRDWVIKAFNTHMPFDEFTVRQLAGDYLVKSPTPSPSDYDSAWRGELIRDPKQLDAFIPTAFNRNHRGNAEGGIIPEEYQAEYVVDRVDTTATVWLGLTLGCCRCHDHKYDPFSQKDYYQLFAYFNNLPEFGRAIKEGNSPPSIRAPTRQQRRELKRLELLHREAKQAAASALASDHYRRSFEQWVKAHTQSAKDELVVERGIVSRVRLDRRLFDDQRPDQRVRLVGPKGAEIFEAENDASMWAAGRQGDAIALADGRFLDLGDFADFGYFQSFTVSAWARPTSETGTIVSRMTLGAEKDGYYLHLKNGHVEFNLVKRWLDDSIRVATKAKIPLDRWTHITATYDGSRYWRGLRIYIDGQPTPIEVRQDFINQTFAAKEQPVRIGAGAAAWTGQLDDVRIYDRALSAVEAKILAEPKQTSQLASNRSFWKHPKLTRRFRHEAPASIQAALQRQDAAARALQQFTDSLPTLMVMQEMKSPRSTHVLRRGQHDQLGEQVFPSTPSALQSPDPQGERSRRPSDAQQTRLDLARWLVSPKHPLTARVFVNRLWQMHFGVGLVKTAEDFGIQGERPSHPELLDYLATELIRSRWNVQHVQTLIVTSATYRQSSHATAERHREDPENRRLSRGPRYRLPAEMVRDQSLAASGLLRHRLGGASVRPYQPEGLWKEIATDTDYKQSHGDDLYRRSLYTYWKRTVAPPTMMTLDAVSREACTVKRSRTNTPLQALALMNETAFVECARKLAERVLVWNEGDSRPSDAERIGRMVRLVISREPTGAERQVLSESLGKFRQQFELHQEDAEKLLAVGESPVSKRLSKTSPQEHAAFTMLASLVLNLDEAITKE